MIGIDTNLLARLVLDDDPEQSALARRFFGSLSEDEPGYVNLLTLSELLWLLGSRVKWTRRQRIDLVVGLLESREIVMEAEERVRRAIEIAEAGRAELPDILIALTNEAAGCTKTMTFDRQAAAQIASMAVLA